MEYDKKIKDIDKSILDLINKKQMNATDALSHVKGISGKINDILEDTTDLTTRYSLCKKTSRAYSLALKRVSGYASLIKSMSSSEYRNLMELEFSLNYWTHKARQSQLRLVESRTTI